MQTTTISEGHTVPHDPTVSPHHSLKESEKHNEQVEMRVASSTSDSRAVSISDLKAQTKRQRLRARVQFATVCGSMYLAGWNDGTTGPLLPRIQKVYGLNFAVVSLVFVFACVGFLSGAFANLYLDSRFGFGKVIVLGSACQVIAYAIEAGALPFPAFVLGYAINGFGMALQDAQSNGFVASLKDNPEVKMGILHAVSVVLAVNSRFILSLKGIRCRRFVVPFGSNTICSASALVISLPVQPWCCIHKHCIVDCSLWAENTG